MRSTVARFALPFVAACVASAPPAAADAWTPPDEALLARARALTHRALLADTHVDVPYRLEEGWEDVTRRTEKGDFDAERAREGGLDLVWMSIYVPAEKQKTGGAKALADQLIDRVEALVGRAPDRFALAPTADAAETAKKAGRIGLAMGIENGAAIEDDLANLAHFAARGVRYVTLTHSEDNLICDSSYVPKEKRTWHGLSPFGREVVGEMNRLGILVDLSHVSDESFDQAIEIAKAPPIASHSSARHFTPEFERNLDDARIVKLAEKGGVIQINFGSAFLRGDANAASLAEWQAAEAFKKEHGDLAWSDPQMVAFQESWRKDHPPIFATVADVADHIDHVVKLAGVDHVGLGSDFDGVGDSLPVGLKSVADYPNLVAELLRRGYSDEEVTKILGGNLMRVWREAEKVAGELQREQR
ncbi:MAG: membrane dipeptidase [Holophagales bacterium]|nr:membrane dipeptidase [Holophagales bacterium]